MPFEAYTPLGLARGEFAPSGPLARVLETFSEVAVAEGRLARLDGGSDIELAGQTVSIDDLLVVVAPETTQSLVHATWHELELSVGPYLVRGEMPTLPGLDPGRALVRPSGSFVLLRSVRIALLAGDAAACNEHQQAWVNRYTVERVAADIDLTLFFPGAEATRLAAGTSTSAAG